MFRRFLLCLPFLLVVTLRAQSVRWEPAGGTLALNQVSELTLIFEQCEPKGSVSLPAVPNLDFSNPSRSEQNSFSIINGNASRSTTVSLTYQVTPSSRQTITIPAFDVATDKGTKHVASATFDIGDATVGQSNLSLDAVAQSKFTLPHDDVWAGEVFPLRYTLNATRRYFYQMASTPDWDASPLSVEPWDKPEQLSTMLNGEERISILYKTRAVAKTPGTITLKTASQLVNLATGTSAFGVFSRPNLEQFSVISKPATLVVKPLPTPTPADFNGAVGQFTLDSKVVPATAAVGEPITWTLTLAGTGNWPDLGGLPPRSVSKDFRIVQPQAKRTSKDNSLFDASLTEDIVLVPTKPGPYTLGPVTLSYFDPATGTYQTLKTEPVTITISPGATTPAEAGNLGSEAGKPGSTQAGPQNPKSEITPPGSIPRDPLSPASPAPSPLTSSVLLTGLLASVIIPLLTWLTLALRRARTTDPRLPQRAARTRLTTTLATLGNTRAPTQIITLLQQWQHDVAILWKLDLAVPTASSFTSADGTSSTHAEAWSALWNESERVLYREASTLPEDWIARAQAALAAKRVPGFSAFQLFLPRNLLPLCIIVASLAAAHSSFAADGRSAYAKGDFAAAETFWSDALKTDPTDWTAQHNLSLTLVQQNRWGEASGHALAAFVQQPQNPAVRWNLEFALTGAGLRPVEVMPFVDVDPLHQLARFASPAIWQYTLLAAVWLIAASLALWFWLAYGKRHRLKPAAWTLFALALIVALAAGTSLHLYGPLADTRTVFVAKATTLRSIPTDLDSPQKSSPLTAGLIATTDKTFLGWQRIAFPNGQTGWVRSTDLVPLWK
ncbi:MAG TPA: BatD family protein [Rariglobus sp.]|jgi:hypothetical protein|nr:BatD family protein [Rariglobus sp.]